MAQDLCHRTENRNPITPPLHVVAAGNYEPAVDIEPAPPQILSIVTCTLVILSSTPVITILMLPIYTYLNIELGLN